MKDNIQRFNEYNNSDTKPNMNDKVSIETIQVIADNINTNIGKFLLDKKHIELFIRNLQDDLNEMYDNYGDEDEDVKKYRRIITELNNLIK